MLSRNRTPPIVDHVMCERKPPVRFNQKVEPIDVVDKVRVRDDKTADYWFAVVISIEVDDITVQWVGDDGLGV